MRLFKNGYTCLPLLIQILCVCAQRTRDKMYDTLSGASCFRRLNGTHQMGCSSAQSGSVGVLHLITIEEDFQFLFNSPPAPPYAPIIPPHLFTRNNMLRLKHEAGQNISVVLLINKSNHMTHFSNELNCPNQYSGIMFPNSSETPTCNAQQPADSWNPYGSGLLHEDFPFPIFYLADQDEVDKITNCFEKFNNFDFQSHARRRLCAIEINTFMYAAVSSEVCIRRSNFINNLGNTKYCDPLEGRNVYATLFPRKVISNDALSTAAAQKPISDERFILVTCRLDTTSMFDGVGLGALDSLLGYATLTGAAHMLSQLLPQQQDLPNKKLNMIFVIFNGESHDYIGSQRFVYDLEKLAFPDQSTQTNPISLDNIDFLLDIGTLDDTSLLNLHSITESAESKQFIERLQKSNTAYDLKINFKEKLGYHMPPTSAQSFLRKNISFPAFVLNSLPLNKFYHSIYDDSKNSNFTYGNTSLDYTALVDSTFARDQYEPDSIQMKIRNVSSAIALALYETLTGAAYNGSKLANPILIDEFLFCFLESAACPLFKAASGPDELLGLPLPPMRYISVSGASQEASGWTYRLLGYLLSQKLPKMAKENCTAASQHWFSGFDLQGECRLTTQNFSTALSPAFEIEDYDWTSGQYSTWTESTWSQFSARIFLRPSRFHEMVVLTIGIFVLVVSFFLVYFLSSRSEILFEDAPSSTDALTRPAAC